MLKLDQFHFIDEIVAQDGILHILREVDEQTPLLQELNKLIGDFLNQHRGKLNAAELGLVSSRLLGYTVASLPPGRKKSLSVNTFNAGIDYRGNTGKRKRSKKLTKTSTGRKPCVSISDGGAGFSLALPFPRKS